MAEVIEFVTIQPETTAGGTFIDEYVLGNADEVTCHDNVTAVRATKAAGIINNLFFVSVNAKECGVGVLRFVEFAQFWPVKPDPSTTICTYIKKDSIDILSGEFVGAGGAVHHVSISNNQG